MGRDFNADQRSAEREKRKVTIGENEFTPVRLVNAVRKDVRRISREGAKEIEEHGRAEKARLQEAGQTEELFVVEEGVRREQTLYELGLDTAEGQDASTKNLFEQIRVLIKDAAGKHPTGKFLDDNLDPLVGGDLLRDLLGIEPDAEGNASTGSGST